MNQLNLLYGHSKRSTIFNKIQAVTNVTSRDAAAALMCKLGCFTELEQSKALAKVPTDLEMTKN